MVLHREVYAPVAASGYAEFDERMKAFQHGQRMPEAGWTAHAAARVRGPDAMSGRHLLQAALKRLGFGLA